MSKLSKLASAMPFAHYLGLSGAAAAVEEDDERKQREGESDDDYAKRMEEMDEEEEKARKAEEEKKEEEAKRAEEEKRKEEEAKKAKRAEDENDVDGDGADAEDDEEEGARAGRAQGARQRERIRCAKIVAAGIKGGRVNQACVFAFDSSLTSAQAIAALGAAALDAPKESARTTGLRERMSVVTPPNPGANGGAAPNANPASALANRIVAAGERARGK
ncbi:hypothetical protein [Burkholderia pseudomallei]|uniref:hypothetical protein n=1 Tax=Burkholderia pseudomallei TaxID=28450 RepID=UPI000F0D99B5|nr:hypothetical protein [Burkholderia pseudomallei]VBM94984.1 Uncharacterised protein [Burkholderia pseudomallei]